MTTVARRLPPGLLVGLGAVVFLANAGLLVLQLLAGKFLAPFIGSSVETWTSVIGVFLAGIALGNHVGGRIADRRPATRTLGLLLIGGAVSSLSLIGGWTLCQSTGFDRVFPLTLRIPVLAAVFCFPPAFVLSLITPLTIKLMMSDVQRAGSIAGVVFALGTLGCLLGNYVTGFWLLADYTLNTISLGVAVGLAVLSVPMFLVDHRLAAEGTVSLPRVVGLGKAYAIVFTASFCGMSLELTASRVLAPTLGVSLFTWTGIIGVMLAGTACGNYLGGVLADRGVGPALQRLGLLVFTLVGFAGGPALVRTFRLDDWPTQEKEDLAAWWAMRGIGALLGLAVGAWAIVAGRTRRGRLGLVAGVGALVGFVVAFPVVKSFGSLVGLGDIHGGFAETNAAAGFDVGAIVVHLMGAVTGGLIALGLGYDPPGKEAKPVGRQSALSTCFFCAALFTGLVVLMNLFFQNPNVGIAGRLSGTNIVWNVLTWTFILFFLPMLCLGTISPQVIRLSVTDTAHAGRVAGSVYAWSTVGAIVGTFVTGYFLIDWFGMARVLFLLSLTLLGLAFVLGRLWKNTPLLFAASIVCGIGVVGLFVVGYGKHGYDLETKYYAIKVGDDRFGSFGAETATLSLDHLIHSYVRVDDPTWLGYPHEEIQGELVRHARSKGPTEVLVIGGGGYTFPRWVEFTLPDVGVDVVEIDPGVTEIAHRKLGLSRQTKIRSHHMDGRQFIREKAAKGHYQYVIQDAVNDLSVPYHLMTKEYNDAVKATLAPGGAYLLTLIDSMEKGALWMAAVHTLRQSFPHVTMLDPAGFQDTEGRHVYVIYAADTPLDLADVRAVAAEANLRAGVDRAPWTNALEAERLEGFLQKRRPLILTDQYAPVDNLMADIFRNR